MRAFQPMSRNIFLREGFVHDGSVKFLGTSMVAMLVDAWMAEFAH